MGWLSRITHGSVAPGGTGNSANNNAERPSRRDPAFQALGEEKEFALPVLKKAQADATGSEDSATTPRSGRRSARVLDSSRLKTLEENATGGSNPKTLEEVYGRAFDPAHYFTKTPRERKTLFSKFLEHSESHPEYLQHASLVKLLINILQRSASKMPQDVLHCAAKSLMHITRCPFNENESGEDLRTLDTAEEAKAKENWLDFITKIGTIPALPLVLSELANAATERLCKLPQKTKVARQHEAWSDIALCWFTSILSLARVLKICRTVVSKESLFIFLFKLHDHVNGIQFSSVSVTHQLNLRTRRVVCELCAVVSQDRTGAQLFIEASNGKMLLKFVSILAGLDVAKHQTELFYAAQCFSCLPLSTLKKKTQCLQLAGGLFEKINFELGPAVDDLIASAEMELAAHTGVGNSTTIDDSEDESESGNFDHMISRTVDDGSDANYFVHHSAARPVGESQTFAAFRLLLAALVELCHNEKCGRSCISDAGAEYIERHGVMQLTPRLAEQIEADRALLQETGNDGAKLDDNCNDDSSVVGDGSHDDAMRAHLLAKLKIAMIGKDIPVATNGTTHLWLHLLRVEQMATLISDKKLRAVASDLHNRTLSGIRSVTPPHTPPERAVEVLMMLFVRKKSTPGSSVQKALELLHLIVMSSRFFVNANSLSTLEKLLTKLFEVAASSSHALSLDSLRLVFVIAVDLGGAALDQRQNESVALIANALVCLMVSPSTRAAATRACSAIIFEKILSPDAMLLQRTQSLPWINYLLDHGLLDVFGRRVFEHCSLVENGTKQFFKKTNVDADMDDASKVGESITERKNCFNEDMRILKWNTLMLQSLDQLVTASLGNSGEARSVREKLIGHRPNLAGLMISSGTTMQVLAKSTQVNLPHHHDLLFDNETKLFAITYRLIHLCDFSQAQPATRTNSRASVVKVNDNQKDDIDDDWSGSDSGSREDPTERGNDGLQVNNSSAAPASLAGTIANLSTSPENMSRVIIAIHERREWLFGKEEQKAELVPLVALVAELASENENNVLDQILTNKTACKYLFETAARTLEATQSCHVLDSPSLLELSKYASFIFAVSFKHVDIRSKVPDEDTADALTTNLINLVGQSVSQFADIVSTASRQRATLDAADTEAAELGMGANKELDGPESTTLIWSDSQVQVPLEILHYAITCLWYMAEYDDTFCTRIMSDPQCASLCRSVSAACAILAHPKLAQFDRQANEVILVCGSIHYLLLTSLSEELHDQFVNPAQDEAALRRADWLEEIVTMAQLVCEHNVHACSKLFAMNDVKGRRFDGRGNFPRSATSLEAMVITLGMCWKFAARMTPDLAKSHLKRLLASLYGIDKIAHKLPSNKITLTVSNASRLVDASVVERRKLSKTTSEEDESDEVVDSETENNEDDERDKHYDGMGTSSFDLVLALRHALLEILNQIPQCCPLSLQKHYRVMLMKCVPAGLHTLASLKRVQSTRLNNFEGSDSSAAHIDQSTSEEDLNMAYHDIIASSEEIGKQASENVRIATSIASLKARRALKAFRQAKMQQLAGDSENSKIEKKADPTSMLLENRINTKGVKYDTQAFYDSMIRFNP